MFNFLELKIEHEKKWAKKSPAEAGETKHI